MADISNFGLRVQIKTSKTFPVGFSITEFADDGDPLDAPSQQVANSAMGPNGDLITWSTANPLKPTLNVIPNSDADKNLAILLEANRASRGKIPARDIVTMTIIYPDGSVTTLDNGVITDGMPINSATSQGRLKTKSYAFSFESKGNS